VAAGERYNEKQKAKALAMFEMGVSLSATSRQLKIPKSTLHMWKEQYAKDKPEILATHTQNAEQNAERSALDKKLEIAGLVDQYKAEFIDKSWDIIRTAETLIERRLKRAVESEDKLDEMITMIGEDSEMNEKTKTALINKIRTAKVDDVVKLSTVLGTLYDKQALANKEATSIVDGNMTVKKFEDY